MARPFNRDARNTNELRRNDRIRVTPVRLIDQNEEQAGVVSLTDAQAMAREAGLDLVEVVPNAKPPVCRILDYGKYKYDLAKKARQAKAHRHETELKEVRIRTPKIDTHDLMIKVERARGFLLRGDRVQFSLRFRGRELAHIDEGQRIFQQIEDALQDCGKVDRNRREGRRITMLIAPLTKQQLLQKRQAANLAAKIARGEIPDPAKVPADEASPEASTPPQAE
ncbi:MAG: translation initiation factor IF-3 [Phycisphaerales bacterium]|nr:translation initiation factor IF-3 [Phycisphaerales bacterium]